MSLTTLLTSDAEIKTLFSTLPNFKNLFNTLNDDGIPFPKSLMPLADLVDGANAGNVGMAYDYWLRAYMQRINQDEDEPKLVADRSIKRLRIGLAKHELEHLLPQITEKYNVSKEIRRQFSIGNSVIERDLYEACIFLGYIEEYFRSGRIRENGYDINPNEVDDLSRIASSTKEVAHFFRKQNRVLYNPSFGDMSSLVGGADADYVIDDMLVEIKTVRRIGYQGEHLRQLIGYYILAKFDKDFPVVIDKLGIFFSRFNRFVYLTIEDIEQAFDLERFSKQFVDILQKKREKHVPNIYRLKMTKEEEAQERIAEVTFKRPLRFAGHTLLNQYANDDGILVDKRNNRPISRSTLIKAIGGKRTADLAFNKGLLREIAVGDKCTFILDMDVLRSMARDPR